MLPGEDKRSVVRGVHDARVAQLLEGPLEVRLASADSAGAG